MLNHFNIKKTIRQLYRSLFYREANLEEQIRQLYICLLCREADLDGLQNWVKEVKRTGDLQVVINGIQKSNEYQQLSIAQAVHEKSVFSNISCLARPERIENLTFNGYSRPLSLQIEPINICNNDCIICPYSFQTRKRSIMSLKLFGKILADYKLLGGGDLSLTPLVGEVLLDKYLPARIEMVKNSGIVSRLSVTTNAVLAYRYDNPTLEYIVQSFDRFKISIYGLDSEEYEVMTRRDEYKKAIESISRILRYSKGNVVLGIRHLKERSAEDVSRWIEELKTRSDCRYPIEVTEAVYEYCNWNIFNTDTTLPFDARWKPNPKNKEQCLIPLLALQITSTGGVSFCACANFNASKELILGDIRRSSLQELYNNEKCKKLYSWKKYGVPEFCKKCSFYVPINVVEQWQTIFSDPPLN